MTHTSFIIYDVVNTSEDIVKINVKIGNGQLASTLVKLEDKIIDDFDNSFEINLGECKQVVKKSAHLFTTIHDINPDNNEISMKLEISGGKKVFKQTVIESSVPQHGDSATALISIAFI